ncbi:DUF2971 domain-containing protein [Devosia chinhatensis]|uniref:DUF2971 domain-containing protein n=1 Tax=Devosia chinhatensis TaxID=429727 RepID=UPI0009FF64BD|nr:DUF2971 domain-containing protein [Devosia chinhatensis]
MAEENNLPQVFQTTDDIGQFEAANNALLGIGAKIISDLVAPQSPTFGLFHYTSSDGFKGIIESNSIRLSDCFFLNDGSEVHYSNQLLWKEIEKFSDAHASKRIKGAAEYIRNQVTQVAISYRPVIFCLSSRPNLLNQWRDYGRDVVPYCVQFQPEALLSPDWSFSCSLFPMTYEENTQESIIKTLIESIMDAYFSNSRPFIHDSTQSTLFNTIVHEIWNVLVQFKHPAFEAEQEWRLASYSSWLDGQSVKFRTSTLGIVPYYARTPRIGTRLPITKVWVGPSPWGRVSQQALDIFLGANGYEVETEASDIPAR